MVTVKIKCFLYALLFISTSAFAANNRLVTITKPYDNGYVDVNINHWDTISFSNGTRICADFPEDKIPEVHLVPGGFVFLDSIHIKAGYKYSSSIKTDSVVNVFVQFGKKTVYFLGGNPDTVWNDALRFPDSLHVLDSIRDFASLQKYSCKYIYVNGPTDKPVSINTPLPNYNAIIYLTSHTGQNMKLQVCDIAYDTVRLGGTAYWYLSVGSYKLRWAVDSLGNGKFDVPTIASGRTMNNARSYKKSDIARLHFWSQNKRIQGGYLINGRIVKAIDTRVVPYITSQQSSSSKAGGL